MRRSNKAVMEMSEIEGILRTGKVCQLALAADPVPYLVTLNYGYHEGALYFHSAREGRKIDMMKINPSVGFSIALDLGLIEGEQACDWSNRFRSVVGHGRIFFLESPEEKRHGLDVIMSQYAEGVFAYPDKMLQATAVYKLVIAEMSAKQSRVEG